jgi:protein-tyrosine phosphatase
MHIRKNKDATEIIPNLWMGNYRSALSKEFINSANIKYIINLTGSIPNIFVSVNYLNFNLDNNNVCKKDLISIYSKCSDYIYDCIKRKEGILVHCNYGTYRSGSVVVAFLIRHMKVEYMNALNYVTKLANMNISTNKCINNGLYKYYLHVRTTIK